MVSGSGNETPAAAEAARCVVVVVHGEQIEVPAEPNWDVADRAAFAEIVWAAEREYAARWWRRE